MKLISAEAHNHRRHTTSQRKNKPINACRGSWRFVMAYPIDTQCGYVYPRCGYVFWVRILVRIRYSGCGYEPQLRGYRIFQSVLWTTMASLSMLPYASRCDHPSYAVPSRLRDQSKISTMFGKSSSSSSSSKAKRVTAPSSLASFFASSSSSSSSSSASRSNTKTKRPRSVVGEDGSSFGLCPLCNESLPLHRLHIHASLCEGGGSGDRDSTGSKWRRTSSNEVTMDCASVPVAHQGGGTSRLSGLRPPLVTPSSSDGAGPDQPAAQSAPAAAFPPPSVPSSTQVATAAAAAQSEQQELPPGLFLYENFVTEEEEEHILKQLDDQGENLVNGKHLPWKVSSFNGSARGKRWGVHCQLKNRCVTPAENELPEFIRMILLPRLRALHSMISGGTLVVPNEANAIDYRKSMGHWLKPHVDDRHLSKEPIANLSLAGDCIMTYTSVSAAAAAAPQKQATYRVLLRRRTLQVLTGKARYAYSHGIRNADLLSDRRVSITLRESPITATADRNPSTETAWWKRPRVLPKPTTGPVVPRPLLLSPSSLSSVSAPIPGLLVFEDFVSPEEESRILSELEGSGSNGSSSTAEPVPSSLSGPSPPAWKAERHSGVHREKRYGMDSELWSRTVREPKHPMPAFVHDLLLPKIRHALNDLTAGWTPNEGNAIEYRRGQSWIKAHVDDRRKHKELIANLSLAGDCYMTFAPAVVPSRTASAAATAQASAPVSAPSMMAMHAGNSASNQSDCCDNDTGWPRVLHHALGTKVLLRRRTLLVLTGKARYEYTHAINRDDVLSARRVSFTLRETA
jgi:alkylated DNA repair dioxygenase AlkB